MALAGEVLQDLAGYLGLSSLESMCDFPSAFLAMHAALGRVGELTLLRGSLVGGLAEGVGGLKGVVVRSEDARVRGDWAGVKKHYAELKGVVGDLVKEYGTREGVQSALVEALKEVNVGIQRGAALRGMFVYLACPFSNTASRTHPPHTRTKNPLLRLLNSPRLSIIICTTSQWEILGQKWWPLLVQDFQARVLTQAKSCQLFPWEGRYG